jgi:hypothetical protein
MPDLLIRNVKPETMAHLKERAVRNGRSVQAEVREVLDRSEEQARRMAEYREETLVVQERFRGRPQPDSSELRHVGRR